MHNNLELARDGYPANAVYDAGASFAGAVDGLPIVGASELRPHALTLPRDS